MFYSYISFYPWIRILKSMRTFYEVLWARYCQIQGKLKKLLVFQMWIIWPIVHMRIMRDSQELILVQSENRKQTRKGSDAKARVLKGVPQHRHTTFTTMILSYKGKIKVYSVYPGMMETFLREKSSLKHHSDIFSINCSEESSVVFNIKITVIFKRSRSFLL